MSKSIKWDQRFLKLAGEVATWSKDRSTQVGAVIVMKDRTPGPYGYNGFPRQIDDEAEERHNRPVKYKWTEHAERNAIYNAARTGVPLMGCTIYVTHIPCMDCTRAIVQVGIERVVVNAAFQDDPGFEERWGEDFRLCEEMLSEAGVNIDYVRSNSENEDSPD
jgi:dCMP deaminase